MLLIQFLTDILSEYIGVVFNGTDEFNLNKATVNKLTNKMVTSINVPGSKAFSDMK